MRSMFLVLCLVACPALAQDRPPMQEVSADLDGDGLAETYALRPGGEPTMDLAVTEDGKERVAHGIAWSGGLAGQQPELSLSPAGSVRLTSMNEGIGRDRWRLTLTVAHRDGDLRVAGLTYDWRDTLDTEAGWGSCDINLLTGRGEVETAAGRRAIAVPARAPLLWDWREEAPPVPLGACLDGEPG